MHPLLTVEIVVGALVVSAGAGGPITAWVLRMADARRRREEDDDEKERAPEEVLRGGTWIGVLERLAVTGSILVGYPAAIAVVVAIKGLGRFPELHAATGVSERFIIGTLCSMLWAAATGVAAAAALGALP